MSAASFTTGLTTLLCLVLLSNHYLVDCKKMDGHIKKSSNFVYLTRFCFDTKGPGELVYTLKGDEANWEGSQIVLFDDNDVKGWQRAYHGSGLTCQERVNMSMGTEVAVYNKQTTVTFLDKMRPHFWWIVLANCNNKSLEFDYNLHLHNYGDSAWTREFSFDEQGLEGLYLFYFLAFLLGGALHAYAVVTLVRSRSYHPIIKMLTVVIALEGSSIFCLFVHYAAYASNGVGATGLAGIGTFLDICGEVVLIALLVVIAKGWAISKSELDDQKLNMILAGMLTLAYFTLFLWMLIGTDTATVFYVYESAPGIIVIIVRVFAMVWFLYSLRLTILDENHPNKRRFYLYFGAIYLVWFLCLPLITAIAAGLSSSEPWMMLKTVTGMYVTSNAIAIAILGYLLWPSRANEYFQVSSHLDVAGTIPYDSI